MMPSEAIDAIDIALLVARAIDAAGGSYFVGGSVASSIQGEPRATNDIDIVLTLPLGRIASHPRAHLAPAFGIEPHRIEILFEIRAPEELRWGVRSVTDASARDARDHPSSGSRVSEVPRRIVGRMFHASEWTARDSPSDGAAYPRGRSCP